jgi:hypothetical protein
MAPLTGLPKPTFMRIIFGMAGNAGGGCAFELAVGVATLASHRLMFSNQGEGRGGMVKGCGFPPIGLMASATVFAKPALMGIIKTVAGITIHRSALKHAISMTRLAGNRRVSPNQCKGRGGVIEGSWLPTIRLMAGAAVFAKLALVRVVLGVTARAGDRRILEIDNGSGALVAAIAGQYRMFAQQVEGCFVVVEGLSVRVHAVMAGGATASIGGDVGIGKCRSKFFVAVTAKGLVEYLISLVAVGADERRPISLGLVCLQGIAGTGVRKTGQRSARQRACGAVVFGVACPAILALPWLGEKHLVKIFGLLGHIGVTGQAGGFHGTGRPEGRMAFPAVLDSRMGDRPARIGCRDGAACHRLGV